jgi:uncharacterized protein (DUF2252 family)
MALHSNLRLLRITEKDINRFCFKKHLNKPSGYKILAFHLPRASHQHRGRSQPWRSIMTVFERIQRFNQMRDPQLVALKDQKMQADVFAFFRETCHLFYEDWPTLDKLDLGDAKGKLGPLEKAVTTMGKLTAWAQLRNSGRQGSAIADELIAFSQDLSWQQPLFDYACAYSHQVTADYQDFKALRAIK